MTNERMTIDETIIYLTDLHTEKRFECAYDTCKALIMAIKALEQQPILDKIRAEIIQMPTISSNANDIYKSDVLAIINKYRVESEEV